MERGYNCLNHVALTNFWLHAFPEVYMGSKDTRDWFVHGWEMKIRGILGEETLHSIRAPSENQTDNISISISCE